MKFTALLVMTLLFISCNNRDHVITKNSNTLNPEIVGILPDGRIVKRVINPSASTIHDYYIFYVEDVVKENK